MKRLLNNIGMKLASVLIAFLIWLVVVTINDPEQTRAFPNVRVAIRNSDAILNADKAFDVQSGDTTTVYIRGRSSVLDSISSSDITVVADMQYLSNLTDTPSVQLQISVAGVNIPATDMWCDPQAMLVEVEDKEEKNFMVSIVTSGQPADGYEVGGTRLTRGDTVVIAGSASTIQKIDRITAPINVSGLSSGDTLETTLRIYDKNGDAFTDTQLSNLEIKTSDGVVLEGGKVRVRVTIWEVENGIELDVGVVGEPDSEYHMTDVITTPETVNLAGSTTALNALDGVLSIPDAVDITGATSSVETTIDLEKYLQDNDLGLKLETDSPTTVSVTVQIEKIGTTVVTIPISELNIVNQPENLNMVLTPADKLSVEVQSEEDNTTIIQNSDVKATLDLSGYQTPGNYTVPVQIELPEGYTLVNGVNIVVNLAEKESESQTEETVLEE